MCVLQRVTSDAWGKQTAAWCSGKFFQTPLLTFFFSFFCSSCCLCSTLLEILREREKERESNKGVDLRDWDFPLRTLLCKASRGGGGGDTEQGALPNTQVCMHTHNKHACTTLFKKQTNTVRAWSYEFSVSYPWTYWLLVQVYIPDLAGFKRELSPTILSVLHEHAAWGECYIACWLFEEAYNICWKRPWWMYSVLEIYNNAMQPWQMKPYWLSKEVYKLDKQLLPITAVLYVGN